MVEKKTGVVKFFSSRGFGFIEGDGEGGNDHYFPFRAFADDITAAEIRGIKGKKVEYTTEPGTGKEAGKTLVKNLRLVKGK